MRARCRTRLPARDELGIAPTGSNTRQSQAPGRTGSAVAAVPRLCSNLWLSRRSRTGCWQLPSARAQVPARLAPPLVATRLPFAPSAGARVQRFLLRPPSGKSSGRANACARPCRLAW